MIAIEKYFILVIVTWRVTHLISNEDGPFEIIFKLRQISGNSFFGKLMDCFYCLSIWIGFLLSIYISNQVIEIIFFTLYFSGTSIIIEKLTNKNFL